MQPDEKSPQLGRLQIAALICTFIVVLLFSLVALDVIGGKVFLVLFSLMGIGWAILGVIQPDWIIGGN